MDWLTLLSPKRLGSVKNQNKASVLTRSAFEQDFDRIVFSSAFRSLQDKTQVFPLPEEAFVHTRLTHSLEVSSVGRSLGKKTGEVIVQRYPALKKNNISLFDFGAVVAAAALAHDVGNPPFGHAGEDAFSDFFKSDKKGLRFRELLNKREWSDLTQFEGNAQGFRILTKNNYQGLSLTYATLAAFTKYPRPSSTKDYQNSKKISKKYGFFQSEKDIFEEIASALTLTPLSNNMEWARHPLAFLVEAADDICYHIIDLEDGCNLGLVSFEQTEALIASILGNKYKPEKLKKYETIPEKIGILRAIAISVLIEQCSTIFLDYEKIILDADFNQSIIDDIPAKKALNSIKDVSIEKIYRTRSILENEAAGFEIIKGLLEAFTTAEYNQSLGTKSKQDQSILRLLPKPFLSKTSNTTYNNIQLIIDYLSSLTDRSAIRLFRKIKGISL